MSKASNVLVFALVAATSTAFAVEWKKHPHLHKAHEQIEAAKKSLKEANDHKKTEFGGHRAKAEELLNQAQHEIQEAVEYADNPANQ
jgi:hypothetical protein